MFSKQWLVFSLVCLCSLPLVADDVATSKQMDEVLAELRKIRALLENKPAQTAARQPNTPITLDVSKYPVIGAKDAPITLVEFMDFQCPYCRQFHTQTFPGLKKLYIDTGKVRFYLMDFPLEIHPQALLAAQAGRCAGDQGKFWPMHDLMEDESAILDRSKLDELAKKANVDSQIFGACLTNAKYREAIQSDLGNFAADGIRVTPTFAIGRSTQSKFEGELLLGAMPLGVFQQKIDSLAPAVSPPPGTPPHDSR